MNERSRSHISTYALPASPIMSEYRQLRPCSLVPRARSSCVRELNDVEEILPGIKVHLPPALFQQLPRSPSFPLPPNCTAVVPQASVSSTFPRQTPPSSQKDTTRPVRKMRQCCLVDRYGHGPPLENEVDKVPSFPGPRQLVHATALCRWRCSLSVKHGVEGYERVLPRKRIQQRKGHRQ